MSLLGFEYFIAVAKEGNISRAAEKLFLSQQSLSAHIKRLEEQYGVLLFDRKPVLRLTPAGKAMLFYVERILQEENQMTARFADLVKDHHGELRLGISRQRAEAFFANIWERYHRKYPQIEILLKEYNSDRLLELLRQHQVDLCLAVNVPESRDLSIEPALEEHLCCSLNADLLTWHRPDTGEDDLQRYLKNGVDLLEIQDLPFFHRPSGNRIRQAVDQLFTAHCVYPHYLLETNNQRLMLSLSSYGVSILTPLYLYMAYETLPLSLGLPQVAKLTNDIFPTTISLVTLKDNPLPDYAQAMKSMIREELIRYKDTVNETFHQNLVESLKE